MNPNYKGRRRQPPKSIINRKDRIDDTHVVKHTMHATIYKTKPDNGL